MKDKILEIIERRYDKQLQIERKAKEDSEYAEALEAAAKRSELHSLIVEVMELKEK